MDFFVIYSLACSVNWSSSLFMFFLSSFFSDSLIHGMIVCVFVWNAQNQTFGEMRCVATRFYVSMSVVSLIVNCLCSIKKEYFNWNESSFGHFKMYKKNRRTQAKWTMRMLNRAKIIQSKKKTPTKKSILLMKSHK